ncbi:MAG TPA: tetraacyldisaccharide 4'-kinase [Candidatus Binatia bacterium]|nr:tetraacyldisaccharide 4'-kinase [Candidatus Binatia bacterium]
MHLRANSTLCRLSLPALNLLSLLYKTIAFVDHQLKTLRQKHFPELFIISVDNLSFGGTGKTPLVIALGQALEKKSLSFAIVSRGYRSSHERNGTLVEMSQTTEEVGDEPWLLKRHFPRRDVIIGRDRLRSIATAAARKNRFVILDDGLQTGQVRKDFSIMLINPRHPYFYLRHFKFMARRESLVLRYRETEAQGAAVERGTYSFAGIDFRDQRHLQVDVGNEKIIAFSALGDNERFQNDMGRYRLAAFRGFPDHHVFRAADLHDLERLRKEKNAVWMVCTEKDFAKIHETLRADLPLIYFRNKIELPCDAIEQIFHHAAEKGFL